MYRNIALLIIFTVSLNLFGYEIYVSPNGDDTNSGTIEMPFATAERARDQIRLLKQNFVTSEAYQVIFRGGAYQLPAPFDLTPDDSGSEGSPVTYRAALNENVVFSGGKELGVWTLHDSENNIWKTPSQGSVFCELYLNDSMAIRARTPNRESTAHFGPYLRINSFDEAAGTIKVDASHIGAWNQLDQVEIVVTPHWYHNRLLFESVTIDGDEASITPRGAAAISAFTKDSSFYSNMPCYYENAYEFLDAPGEWYLDILTETLYYKPQSGEDMTNAVAVVPETENLLRMIGVAENPIHHINSEGISFEHSAWKYPIDNGVIMTQGAQLLINELMAPNDKTLSAVDVEHAHAIGFVDNQFRNLGGFGMSFYTGVKDSHISGNQFVDIAGTALCLDGTMNKEQTDAERCEHIVIDSNYIARAGKIYSNGQGILASFVKNVTIRDNEITDLPYTGIQLGNQSGGYVEVGMSDNLITGNYIHKVVQLHDDGGAIYTLARQTGTVIEKNRVQDTSSGPWAAGWPVCGIYLDNYSENITVRYNTVTNCNYPYFERSGGGGGRNNTVIKTFPAVDDSYSVDGGGELTVVAPGVVANDEGTIVNVTLVTDPSHALSFTLNDDGSFSYVPNVDFIGNDSFSYTIFDGVDSWTAIVSITVKGLLGHWKFDETEGAVAYDSSMSGLNGTVSGTPSWITEGKVDGAFGLDGDDMVSIGDIGCLVKTLTLWVNFPEEVTKSTSAQGLAGYGAMADQDCICIGAVTGDFPDEVLTILGNAGGTDNRRTTIKDNITAGWRHLAFVWNDSEGRYDIYIDGLVQTVYPGVNGHTPLMQWSNCTLGARNDGNWKFTGMVDDVQIYSGSLSEAELLAIAWKSCVFAVNDSYSVDIGKTLAIDAPGVLANDWGTITSCVIEDLPSHAVSFTLNNDGSFTYQPVVGYTGGDTFTYTIPDGTDTSTATVSIEIAGLVGHWKFDETVGTIAADSTVAGLDGTVSVTPSWTTEGQIGGALEFDGDDMVSIGDTGLTVKSLTMWVNFPEEVTKSTSAQGLAGYGATAGQDCICIGAVTGDFSDEVLTILGNAGGTDNRRTTTKNNIAAGWRHIAFAWNDTESYYDIYVDGVARTVYPGLNGHTPLLAWSNFTLGARNDGNWKFTGMMDDVQIYSDSLTEAEINNVLIPAIGLEVTQTGDQLTWSIEDEIGVKEYQVIDADGNVVRTVMAKGDGSYSIDLDSDAPVALVVVDNSGFSQNFLSSDGNVVKVAYDLNKGWNLIAMPGDNADVSALEDVISGGIWGWNGISYEIVDVPTVGNAIWVFAPSNAQAIVVADKIKTELTLESGWNMVGLTVNTEIPVEAHTVYGWNETYQTIATEDGVLIQGIGYWIFSQ